MDFFAHGTNDAKVRKSALRQFRKKFTSAIEQMDKVADIDVPEECLEFFTLVVDGYQINFKKINSEQSDEKPRLRVV